jgi:hypothetical protein
MKLTLRQTACHADRTEWAVTVRRPAYPMVYHVTAYPDGELRVSSARRTLHRKMAPKLHGAIALAIARQA